MLNISGWVHVIRRPPQGTSDLSLPKILNDTWRTRIIYACRQSTGLVCAHTSVHPPAQVPFLSGVDAAKAGIAREGLPRMARKFFAGLHDRARSAAGLSPGYLAVAGLPGSVAFMEVDPAQLTLYFQKHPAKYRVRGGVFATLPLLHSGIRV